MKTDIESLRKELEAANARAIVAMSEAVEYLLGDLERARDLLDSASTALFATDVEPGLQARIDAFLEGAKSAREEG